MNIFDELVEILLMHAYKCAGSCRMLCIGTASLPLMDCYYCDGCLECVGSCAFILDGLL